MKKIYKLVRCSNCKRLFPVNPMSIIPVRICQNCGGLQHKPRPNI